MPKVVTFPSTFDLHYNDGPEDTQFYNQSFDSPQSRLLIFFTLSPLYSFSPHEHKNRECLSLDHTYAEEIEINAQGLNMQSI